jgi:two-component system response regulator MprA
MLVPLGMLSLPLVWIVDDDAAVRLVFHRVLTEAGYAVADCTDGAEALERLNTETPDLIVLDVEMPRLDGWATLAELRQRGCDRPVLMMTRVEDVASRVRGLEAGADDYLGKPCAAPEFLARVRALLRRAGLVPMNGGKMEANVVRLGETMINLAAKTATRSGAPLRLTRMDFALLELLHEHAGKPVAREVILERVWPGQARSEQTSHALDTHLWRLRKKIGDTSDVPQWIRNVPGIGYVMTVG